jgi:hypothetical protein
MAGFVNPSSHCVQVILTSLQRLAIRYYMKEAGVFTIALTLVVIKPLFLLDRRF